MCEALGFILAPLKKIGRWGKEREGGGKRERMEEERIERRKET